MIDLNSIQIQRAAEQLALIPPPSIARRVRCRGDCGRWWYYEGQRKPGKQRGGGRPREWCERCWPLHRYAKRHGEVWPLPSVPPASSSPLTPARGGVVGGGEGVY